MELNIDEINKKLKNLEENQTKIKNALNKIHENMNIIFKDIRWLCSCVQINRKARKYPP